MLHNARLAPHLWALAISHAATMLNCEPGRAPATKQDDCVPAARSPYEAVFARPPNTEHIHVFGAMGQIRVSEKRNDRKTIGQTVSRGGMYVGFDLMAGKSSCCTWTTVGGTRSSADARPSFMTLK